MTFTKQQYTAVTTRDKNFAVIAGAGSGKTHVLVSRFLNLLEHNPDWALNAVVAITFTKKAAAEMRDRVRMQIEARYFEAVNANQEAHANHWQRLLAQMDSARITTIHGLCGELLRTNAAVLGIDPRFQIAEEVDNVTRLHDVIDQVLVDINQNDAELSQLFTYYAPADIRTVLNNMALINSDFPLPTSLDDVFVQWETAKQAILIPFITQAHQFLDKLPFAPHDNKFAENFASIFPLPDEQQIFAQPQLLLESFMALNFRLGGNDIKEFRDEVKAMRDSLKKQLDGISNDYEKQSAQLTLLWARLIERVRTVYREAKTRDNVLDFDDLERLACELLTHHDVRARYQNQEIKHVMVDEFQDTNATQWQIVKGLANITQAGSLFVVGDPKQSIYAFRGADVSVFDGVCKEISGLEVGEKIALSRSFRTHQPLVDVLNKIFSKLMDAKKPSVAPDYQVDFGEAMDANRLDPPNTHPALEIITITDQEKVEGQESPNYREWEAYEIAQRVHQWVNDGRLIYDRHQNITRPIQYGDVALLLRAFSNVNTYEQVFKAQRLPYVTLSGRGYYDTQEIWDCRNGLQALYAPYDNLALASALRSPLFTVSDSALFILARLEQPNLYEGLKFAISHPEHIISLSDADHHALSFALETLETLRKKAGRVTIAELLRELLASTGYLATLNGLPDGAQRRSNVEKLLQKAESSGRVSLSAFLQYLNDMSTQEAREGEAMTATSNSLSIMTVHASKGLEFPAVILGDMSYGGRNHTPIVDFDHNLGLSCKFKLADTDEYYQGFYHRRMNAFQKAKEEAEQLRLFYVGATRAQDILVFSGKINYDAKGNPTSRAGWLKTLIETFGLPHHSNEQQTHSWLDGHHVHYHEPQTVPTTHQKNTVETFTWASSIDYQPIAPPLTNPYHIQRDQQIKHLAATHIADIGAIESVPASVRQYYRDRFRRRVLYDAPNRVESIATQQDSVPAYLIGQIVHEALRHWHIPSQCSDTHLDKILTAYAWRFGLTKPEAIQEALSRSRMLLNQFEGSETYLAIEAAQEVYREMPFMYRLEDTVIHGIIDVVYQDKAGDWHVGDYKTGFVSQDQFRQHAQRYHLQIGIYASALSAHLGTMPQTFIHYVQHTVRLAIPQADWEIALKSKSLRARIHELLEGMSDV